MASKKIEMFKDGISVPRLTLKNLFVYLSPQTYFSLFDQANSDLYHLIKDNNTGGPSIIFHRYHQQQTFHTETKTVYQFHGCFWHGHDCALKRGKYKKPTAEPLEQTRANTEYTKSKGYNVA